MVQAIKSAMAAERALRGYENEFGPSAERGARPGGACGGEAANLYDDVQARSSAHFATWRRKREDGKHSKRATS